MSSASQVAERIQIEDSSSERSGERFDQKYA